MPAAQASARWCDHSTEPGSQTWQYVPLVLHAEQYGRLFRSTRDPVHPPRAHISVGRLFEHAEQVAMPSVDIARTVKPPTHCGFQKGAKCVRAFVEAI